MSLIAFKVVIIITVSVHKWSSEACYQITMLWGVLNLNPDRLSSHIQILALATRDNGNDMI